MNFSIFDQIMRDYLISTPLPGFSVAISDQNETLHTFTYTSERVTSPAITPDTLFEIGSIGKSFTSILFQQLVDAGEYDLHVPVSTYLPWFEVPSKYEPITAHHLLSHTSGLIGGTDFSGDTIAEVYALRDSHTGTPPGTYFNYSNVGYKLLGAILERVTGQSYPDLVRERILEPLGLNTMYPAITHGLRHQMAVGYAPLYDDRPAPIDYPIVPATWLETATADGCIVANPSDLAVYMRMLMNGGRSDVLSNEGYKRMIEPIIKAGERGHYGYGLIISDTPEGQFIGHSGGMVGYTTRMIWNIETGYGFVAMVNAYRVPGMEDLEEWLKKAMLAQIKGNDLPSLEGRPDPFMVTNAEQYAGKYSTADDTLTIVAQDTGLYLLYDDVELPLAQRSTDQFTCEHPNLERFYWTFQRDENEAITSLAYGESLYMAQGFDHPKVVYPEAWDAYRGHYRSHNPWLPAFRVLLRGDKLYMQIQIYEQEIPLVMLDSGVFQVGEDEKEPSRLRFDLLIDGRAIRATVDSSTYYWTFTP